MSRSGSYGPLQLATYQWRKYPLTFVITLFRWMTPSISPITARFAIVSCSLRTLSKQTSKAPSTKFLSKLSKESFVTYTTTVEDQLNNFVIPDIIQDRM